MKLVNIANSGKDIYLFTRNEKKELKIIPDTTFKPYFYEPDESGEYIGYDEVMLKRVYCKKPSDTPKLRSPRSYSSDVRYPIRYITDNIDNIEPTPIKYLFLDMEVLANQMPDFKNPVFPISCITIYNSFIKEYKSWYLGDYSGTIEQKENKILTNFVRYMQEEKPDLLLAWNVSFDYNYLHGRVKNFAKKISPINRVRPSNEDDILYPSGISIMDYLAMFRKISMREPSYTLDSVAEKYLGKGKHHKQVKFGELSNIIKERNWEDVDIMVKLEEKFKIIDYFDEIRRFSLCLWEDLTHNSKILDSIILKKAENMGYVLPNKPKKQDVQEENVFEGAYRRSEEGMYFNVYKADISGCYPSQLVNFCLDPYNIRESNTNEDDLIEIEGTYFKQDKNALVPTLAQELINTKQILKDKLKKAKLNTEEHKILQTKYDAYKGLVNSVFGVMGFSSFRLYDIKVARAITGLARSLLKYCENELEKNGHNVIYTDTDSVMYTAEKDQITKINEYTKEWGRVKGKKDLDIEWETEGKFVKLLIIGKCRYFGYLDTGSGIKKEIKGMEIKRSSSSKYESEFQEQLIEKILGGEQKANVIEWVLKQKEYIRTKELSSIGFPCKIANRTYKAEPIFIRAYNNSKSLKKDFNVEKGERFYYIFVKPFGKDSSGKLINVLAFSDDNKLFIPKDRVDWEEMNRRNITEKSNRIFEAIGWKAKNRPIPQGTLF